MQWIEMQSCPAVPRRTTGSRQPFRLELAQTAVMGVINVTPDSFSDGGLFVRAELAQAQARQLFDDGADLIDIGGESSRPGAMPVSPEEEQRRVLPLLESLVGQGIPVSVDTRKPAVMRAAIAAGAVMINDVNALREPGAIEAVADSDVLVCLMHMRGEPQTMQVAPHYHDVVDEVERFLSERIDACGRAGIARERIVIDPGIGFGKDFHHNLALLHALARLRGLGCPVLVGVSRKAMIGRITGRQVPAERIGGSVAAALWAATRGAQLVRVHDVATTCDALKVWRALEEGQ